MGFNLLNNSGEPQIQNLKPFQDRIELTKEETEAHKEFIKKIDAKKS